MRTTNPTNILFFLNQQKYYHKKNYLSSKTRVFQTY
nr:MAG TPA: hypothetical protein [Caudoviricetes sp.]